MNKKKGNIEKEKRNCANKRFNFIHQTSHLYKYEIYIAIDCHQISCWYNASAYCAVYKYNVINHSQSVKIPCDILLTANGINEHEEKILANIIVNDVESISS